VPVSRTWAPRSRRNRPSSRLRASAESMLPLLWALVMSKGLVGEKALRRIVVRVDHDGAVVNLPGAGGTGVGLDRLSKHHGRSTRTARPGTAAHEIVSCVQSLSV